MTKLFKIITTVRESLAERSFEKAIIKAEEAEKEQQAKELALSKIFKGKAVEIIRLLIISGEVSGAEGVKRIEDAGRVEENTRRKAVKAKVFASYARGDVLLLAVRKAKAYMKRVEASQSYQIVNPLAKEEEAEAREIVNNAIEKAIHDEQEAAHEVYNESSNPEDEKVRDLADEMGTKAKISVLVAAVDIAKAYKHSVIEHKLVSNTAGV